MSYIFLLSLDRINSFLQYDAATRKTLGDCLILIKSLCFPSLYSDVSKSKLIKTNSDARN